MSANAESPQDRERSRPGLADLSEQIASARAQSAAARAGVNGAAPSTPGAGEADIPPLAVSSRRPWVDYIGIALSRAGTALARPPVRLAATGVLLLLVAILFLSSSVWTLPLIIVGALMVLVAWVGSRLRGHILLEWGETGAQLDFHAEVASARQRQTRTAVARRPVIAAVPAPETVSATGRSDRR